ncbi:MAG: hypothetical protein KDK97_14550 [Verrucomicrobiales bacterium]|nr:hypothetical protein [Verrucomicrobiales bacterium]MCP5558347.1 hypothetical protein [Verrucomicrobiaceae bacterium]
MKTAIALAVLGFVTLAMPSSTPAQTATDPFKVTEVERVARWPGRAATGDKKFEECSKDLAALLCCCGGGHGRNILQRTALGTMESRRTETVGSAKIIFVADT